MSVLQLEGPQADFHSPRYLRNTARRLEHLATLGLDLFGRTVLELGAGIGDLTTFFVDRDCTVHSTEPRAGNLEILRRRYADEPRVTVETLDLDPPPPAPRSPPGPWDVVFCYGVLYHLSNPEAALDYMAACCRGLLLLESICSAGDDDAVNPKPEQRELAGSAVTGRGCRPTRVWIHRTLRDRFEYVYVPSTQPHHCEFPLDWTVPWHDHAARAIFIAARAPVAGSMLLDTLPDRYERSRG